MSREQGLESVIFTEEFTPCTGMGKCSFTAGVGVEL